jgi:hypothetical protein
MKPILLITCITLAATSWSAAATPTDRSYYVMEMSSPQRFDVYNDGYNTYLESIPGLVVTGATADGERYIVTGVPQHIRGFMNGKPITVARGIAPAPKPAPRAESALVNAEVKRLSEELVLLKALKAQPIPGAPPHMEAARIPTTETAAARRTVVPAEIVAPSKWTIAKGEPIHIAMESWAKKAGWTLLWYPSVSWKAISDVDMQVQKDVVAAVSEVVTVLRDEGKPVRLRVSDGNKVMEVLSTEVKND